MKCEIANDLLTLYVEDLCSPETEKELKAHLRDCPECEKKLENYRRDLMDVSQEVTGEKDATAQKKAAEIEPMKKIKKKMKKSKSKIIALSVVIAVILGWLGVLSYGEATNLYPGFTVISDALKIKSACKELAKGETEAFMDLLAYHLDDQYIMRATGAFEDMDAYMANIRSDVEEAYKYYFEGKDVKVRLTALYSNPYSQTVGADEEKALIGISFYEGSEILYQMEFGKVAHNSYSVYENYESPKAFDAPSFTGGMIPYDDIILRITLPYAAQSGYRKLVGGEAERMGSGLVLVVEKTEESENEVFDEQMKEKMNLLYESGCYIKHVNYNIADFDTESGKWVYSVWITYEDQHTGNVFVTEQKFLYHNDKMYVMEGEVPVVSSMSSAGESVSTETIELALSMFQ